MSVQAMAAAWRLDVTFTEKFVALTLANFASHDGSNCFPGQALIAQMTGLSLRAVRNAIIKLEKRGLIARSQRRRNDGYRSSDEYRLIFASPADLAGSDSPAPGTILTGTRVRAITNRQRNRQRESDVEKGIEEVVVNGETVVPFRRARP